MSEEATDKEYKLAFAELLLQTPDDPFTASLKLFPTNTNRAVRVAGEWPRDPVVTAEMKRLRSEGHDIEKLPTKADLAREVWKRAQAEQDSEAATKLFKLYGDIRGFIVKPDSAPNVNVNVVPKVMIVKDSGTDDAWEARLQRQQRKLKQEVAASDRDE